MARLGQTASAPSTNSALIGQHGRDLAGMSGISCLRVVRNAPCIQAPMTGLITEIPLRGLEHPPKSPRKTPKSRKSGAKSGERTGPENADSLTPPDHWQALPPEVRRAIEVLLNAGRDRAT